MRMATTLNTDNIRCWWGRRVTGTRTHCWWECNTVEPHHYQDEGQAPLYGWQESSEPGPSLSLHSCLFLPHFCFTEPHILTLVLHECTSFWQEYHSVLSNKLAPALILPKEHVSELSAPFHKNLAFPHTSTFSHYIISSTYLSVPHLDFSSQTQSPYWSNFPNTFPSWHINVAQEPFA